jgi:hypothetical protein
VSLPEKSFAQKIFPWVWLHPWHKVLKALQSSHTDPQAQISIFSPVFGTPRMFFITEVSKDYLDKVQVK